ncbi:TIGR03667 family PPOX class F420-dependent oxidoreductase [Saccharomonospora sp. NPDC046836]|uniref:TIGR03667 family PPOX class F420-dependent oxidoreductase n=1 Tax=Saccharomonospora sp. NPDC046836 TaxID=3156921 RepID=UPI0033DE7970
MAADVLPAAGTPFGDRVRRRLREEQVLWFTTVGADGTPQPNPVWFLWDDGSLLIYNRAQANRLVHVRHRPHVSLHFDGDGHGGDIVVFTGVASLAEDEPAPADHPAYLKKYAEGIRQVVGSVERFSEEYPVALRVRLERVRGY